ncbi:threonine--tRNA ligase [symbiont of Argiope bruennichi]|uniref:threonine--tRNA ligase n=1 Tax=symbiont of Argiope bruennichi TaxID=2810479 RepID=UPI003DA4A180
MAKKNILFPKNLSFSDFNKKYFPKIKLLAIKANNKIFDHLSVFNEKLTNISLITDYQSYDYFLILNHSCAHILASAVKNLYKNVSLWIGPSSNEGFFYDFYFEKEEEINLSKISSEMKKIIKSNLFFKKEVIDLKSAKEIFKNDPLKEIILSRIKDSVLSYYQIGSFIDLCRGPHVKSTLDCKNFALLNSKKINLEIYNKIYQIIRISGICFHLKDDLEKYLKELENQKKYDHREINKIQNLFFFDEKSGQGLPFFLPNGSLIFKKIANLIYALEAEFGYQRVMTPLLGSIDLYQKSGHYEHYKENIFPEINFENEKLILRPMACPHHCLVFQKLIQSYRQLPLRLSEEVVQFRYEYSGGLSGLERVRMMHLTDAHIFVSEKNLFQELKKVFSFIQKTLNLLKIEKVFFVLATNDPNDKKNFLANRAIWKKATNKLKKVLISNKIEFEEKIGEAAFYGPKIDIEVKTSLNKKITLSTLQLDYFLPKKFDLFFTNEKNEKEIPVLIHRGVIGTYERFLAIIIENNQGNIPFFLSPFQVNIIPINEKYLSFCKLIQKKLQKNNFSGTIDDSDKSFNFKIRNSQKMKYWYTIIIGEQEFRSNTITFRKYQNKNSETTTLNNFLKELKNKINFLKKYWNII